MVGREVGTVPLPRLGSTVDLSPDVHSAVRADVAQVHRAARKFRTPIKRSIISFLLRSEELSISFVDEIGTLRDDGEHLRSFRLVDLASIGPRGAPVRGACASASGGTLETTLVKVCLREFGAVHQFEGSESVGHHITLTSDSLTIQIGIRAIVTAEMQAIFLDRVHQCPQADQFRITIKVIRIDHLTVTNASVNLLLDCSCFLVRNKLYSGCHLAGKCYNFLHIIERCLILEDVCFRLHKQNVIVAVDFIINRARNLSIFQFTTAHVFSVGSNDDGVTNHLRKLIGNGVRLVFIRTTETDKITLIDKLTTGKILQTSAQNLNQICVGCLIIIGKHVCLSVANLDFLLVKNRFGSYKEITSGRIGSPNNSRGTVDLDGEVSSISEPIKARKIASENRIFGMLKVEILGHLVRFV